jgi:plastocyanin
LNQKKISTNSKQTQIIAVAIIAASVLTAAVMINGISFIQNIPKAMAQDIYPSGNNTAAKAREYNKTEAKSSTNITALSTSSASGVIVKSVSTNQSNNKEFWINTVHLDGMTSIHPGMKCDTCAQNTPTHPAEQPPINSTIPTGGGFRVTDPNKIGAWDFRSFTFSPDQIVVNQGDKVTLHFVGVQGAHHVISVEGVDTFELARGQIHTISFIAKNPGTIAYMCHVHMPNMVGQILVLPKAAV